jgi:GNAT superfamily N-acetyltransferase
MRTAVGHADLCQAPGVTHELTLRRAEAGDAESVARVWLRSFAAALPSVRLAHTDEEVRAWIRSVVIGRLEAWVAVTADDTVVGIMALEGTEIDQLYLDPRWRGCGIGDRLIAHAKSRRPSGLGLWTFQVNGPARRFYERHGFVEVARTDGSGNEEAEPDVRLEWTPLRGP